jgi:hypothetical protein
MADIDIATPRPESRSTRERSRARTYDEKWAAWSAAWEPYDAIHWELTLRPAAWGLVVNMVIAEAPERWLSPISHARRETCKFILARLFTHGRPVRMPVTDLTDALAPHTIEYAARVLRWFIDGGLLVGGPDDTYEPRIPDRAMIPRAFEAYRDEMSRYGRIPRDKVRLPKVPPYLLADPPPR